MLWVRSYVISDLGTLGQWLSSPGCPEFLHLILFTFVQDGMKFESIEIMHLRLQMRCRVQVFILTGCFRGSCGMHAAASVPSPPRRSLAGGSRDRQSTLIFSVPSTGSPVICWGPTPRMAALWHLKNTAVDLSDSVPPGVGPSNAVRGGSRMGRLGFTSQILFPWLVM